MKCKQSIPDVISDSIEMRKGFSSFAKQNKRSIPPRRTNTQPVIVRQHSDNVASATIRPFTAPSLSYIYKPRDTIVKIDEDLESSSQHPTVVITPVNSDEIKEASEKIAEHIIVEYEDAYLLAKGTAVTTVLMILILIFLFVKFWGNWKVEAGVVV